MNGTAGGYSPRLSPRQTVLTGVVWLLATLILTAPLLRWHLEFAAASHPKLFPAFAGFLVAAAFGLPAAYQFVRTRGCWKWEPVAFAAGAILVPAVYEPLGTLITVWLLLGCFGVGATAIEKLRFPAGPPLERLVLGAATGLGILVWPLTLLGHFGLLAPGPLLGLLAAATVAGAGSIQTLPALAGELYHKWTESDELRSPWIGLAICFAAVLLVCGLFTALPPSINYDALKFHLPLARHYAETSALVPLQSDNYGYNPQNFELLLTIGYRFAGQEAAELIAPAFTAIFTIALLAAGRRIGFSRAAAVTGAVFALAVPYIHMTGANVKHDLIVGFLQLASLLCYLTWREHRDVRWIFLGVFLAATGLGFKHPAAFGVIGLALLFIPAAWNSPKRWKVIGISALIGVSIGLFWQARSYALTGDPFVYYQFSQPLPEEHLEQVGTPLRRVRTLLTWPYLAHFEGTSFYRSVSPAPLGVLLVLLAPLWILLRPNRADPNALAALTFTVGALIPWAFYVPLLRFVTAPVALLVMLSMHRLISFAEEQGPAVRIPALAAAAYSAMFSLCVIAILEINAPQFDYLGGRIDRTGYLRQALATYRPLEVLRALVTPGDRVLGINNCSVAYAPDPDLFYCLDPSPDNPAQVAHVLDHVADRRFRFVILPRDAGWETKLEKADRPMIEAAGTTRYKILELQ